jgi:large subunit ribosomal protein L4
MELKVYNINGEELNRTVDLPEGIFGLELNEKHEHVVYLAVKQYNAAQRQGTHKAKERAEIKGSTRKIKKQKGTGTARAGSIKNPLFRGGGRVFGPRPRNYNIKLNKKVKQLARKAVLSAKAKEGKIIIVEDFTFDKPQTKAYLNMLTKLSIADNKSVLMLNAPQPPAKVAQPTKPGKARGAAKKATLKARMEAYSAAMTQYNADIEAYNKAMDTHAEQLDATYSNVVLSSRNIKGANVTDAGSFNVYEVMNANVVVLSESSVKKIKEVLG